MLRPNIRKDMRFFKIVDIPSIRTDFFPYNIVYIIIITWENSI